ncbi:MAG: BPSS1780 family membrane protein [Duganella sp.]
MNTFTARAGLQWVKQGMQVFRKQPGALMALFFCCMFLSMGVMIIPLVGQVAPFVLTPLFTIALLEGCKHADAGQRALPNLLLSGFRKPVRSPLLTLGALNFVMLLLAAAILYALGGDTLNKIIAARPKQVAPEQVEGIVGAVFAASGFYTLSWILTCLAAPLVYFQKLTVGKALFFSVVSVARGFKPFLVATIMLHLLYFVGCQIVVLVFGGSPVAVAGVFTLFLLTIVLAHCTLYVAYRELFPQPPAAAPVDLGKDDTPDPML